MFYIKYYMFKFNKLALNEFTEFTDAIQVPKLTL